MRTQAKPSLLAATIPLLHVIAGGMIVWIAAVPARAAVAPAAPEVRFNRDIRPIMSDTCFKCHGPGTRKAGLRLDLRDEALKPTESGDDADRAGQAGRRARSVRRVLSTDQTKSCRRPSSHKTLTAEQKELIRRWIAQGAPYEKHWSFEPPVKAEPPRRRRARRSRVRNPIDAFIADACGAKGLTVARGRPRDADPPRGAWPRPACRRRSSEVDAFLADTSADAYEKMVDRYLASPRFGEEMARHWLDVARYADTHGLHLDNERQMWAYRDWVVKAFNDNLPFDQFTIEQLAGDLLPNADAGAADRHRLQPLQRDDQRRRLDRRRVRLPLRRGPHHDHGRRPGWG